MREWSIKRDALLSREVGAQIGRAWVQVSSETRESCALAAMAAPREGSSLGGAMETEGVRRRRKVQTERAGRGGASERVFAGKYAGGGGGGLAHLYFMRTASGSHHHMRIGLPVWVEAERICRIAP